jgi:hypothetical protein
MHLWIYIFGSPHEAKNYTCSLSVNGKDGNKYTYYGYVKPLGLELKLPRIQVMKMKSEQ